MCSNTGVAGAARVEPSVANIICSHARNAFPPPDPPPQPAPDAMDSRCGLLAAILADSGGWRPASFSSRQFPRDSVNTGVAEGRPQLRQEHSHLWIRLGTSSTSWPPSVTLLRAPCQMTAGPVERLGQRVLGRRASGVRQYLPRRAAGFGNTPLRLNAAGHRAAVATSASHVVGAHRRELQVRAGTARRVASALMENMCPEDSLAWRLVEVRAMRPECSSLLAI